MEWNGKSKPSKNHSFAEELKAKKKKKEDGRNGKRDFLVNLKILPSEMSDSEIVSFRTNKTILHEPKNDILNLNFRLKKVSEL